MLFNPKNNLILGLIPENFVAIASPFLGAKDHTYIPLPRYMELFAASIFKDSGRDIFMNHEKNNLIYEMCTSQMYLRPLAAFKSRRLYAALENDFMVTPQVRYYTVYAYYLPLSLILISTLIDWSYNFN